MFFTVKRVDISLSTQVIRPGLPNMKDEIFVFAMKGQFRSL